MPKRDPSAPIANDGSAGRGGPATRHRQASWKFGTSYAECNRIAREARSSFYLAFYGLRKPKRNALCALYAFMRLVDNVSDEPGDLESKRRGLARWRAMLDEAVAGQYSRPRRSSRAWRTRLRASRFPRAISTI